MTGRTDKNRISKGDRELWRQVKKTITPLGENERLMAAFLERHETIDHQPNRKVSASDTAAREVRPTDRKPQRPTQIIKPYVPERAGHTYRPKGLDQDAILDDKTWRHISKGRKEIDAKVDLHGMTQVEAHARLLEVLDRVHRRGGRIVLVITGKGREGQGILRQAVPRWLQEPAFRALVSGYREAHIGHGGSGALYVRVRRLPSVP